MTFVRDFIYLDVERVRSLVSQLEQGLVESFSKSLAAESSVKGNVKAGVFGLAAGELGVEQLWRRDTHENRSLNDYIYTKLEEKLIEYKILRKVDVIEVKGLGTEALKASLSSTEFILLDASVELNDLSRMRSLIENFNELGKFFAWTSAQSLLESGIKAGGSEYQKALKAARSELQIDRNIQDGLSLVIKELIGEKILLRVIFDCIDTKFVGVLDPSLMREDMGSVLIKYGSRPAENWRVFCQVASLRPNTNQDSSISAADEGIHMALLKLFDAVRAVDKTAMPYSPSDITITPIAVYRQTS
ncbi:hypothetical protein FKV24_018400 [Lysobacter maris]|uniref:Uncharacterized protein n=1 Tax=Marilutibacter maris TaxID=1605891 RepID=A0A507ZSI7_9GAMM|nr:hypothetical protein [Lysobacter maris]KAB8162402.1 hypothetical protein FKV24_018400 [Lysobacter maris]